MVPHHKSISYAPNVKIITFVLIAQMNMKIAWTLSAGMTHSKHTCVHKFSWQNWLFPSLFSYGYSNSIQVLITLFSQKHWRQFINFWFISHHSLISRPEIDSVFFCTFIGIHIQDTFTRFFRCRNIYMAKVNNSFTRFSST